MSYSTIHIGRVSGVQANYNYDPVDQEDTMKIQSNMYINNPNMTSRNIEKKENGSHALVQEDDIQISASLVITLLIAFLAVGSLVIPPFVVKNSTLTIWLPY